MSAGRTVSRRNLLSFSDAATALGSTLNDVRRWVIEDRTLTAVHVFPGGQRRPFLFGGLQVYSVGDDGAVTDLVHGGEEAGHLRIESAEIARYLAAYPQVQSAALAPAVVEAASPQVQSAALAPAIVETVAERRLNRLEALGGTVKYKKLKWRFTGIGKLVKEDEDSGQARASEKTIRKDLKEAALARSIAKASADTPEKVRWPV